MNWTRLKQHFRLNTNQYLLFFFFFFIYCFCGGWWIRWQYFWWIRFFDHLRLVLFWPSIHTVTTTIKASRVLFDLSVFWVVLNFNFLCCESRETEEMRRESLELAWGFGGGRACMSLHKPLVKHQSTTSTPWISCFYKDHCGQRKADVKVPSIAIEAWRPFKGILLSNLLF